MEVIVLVLSIPVLFFLLSAMVGYYLSGPGYEGPVSDHFDGKQFINPGGVKAKGPKDIFKWMREGREKRIWKEDHTPPMEKDLPDTKEGETRITFINHSSFLIQTDGVNLLLDPVFSKYASPFQFAGPKRMRQPGISLDSLPRIDLVLLSHNHYDHLDLPTLTRLYKRDQPKFIVPLGVDRFLGGKGFRDVTALDWWEKASAKQLEVTATPAQHFSGRGLFDRDRTLWCGYAINSSKHKVYFVGDSGYGDFFSEIGERLGRIDAAIIPIGAFKPRWFMQPIHVSPEEAVQVHEDVGSPLSIACHFGTFPLADDSMGEPEARLKELLRGRNGKGSNFCVPVHGQSFIID